MIVRRRKPFNRTMCIGLIFLSVANVTNWALERHSTMPEGPRDGVFGLLLGLAIGCLLLGMWRARHADAASDEQRCV